MQLSELAMAMFLISVDVYEIFNVQISQCARFESLTLKIKIKDIEDLTEN